MASMVLDNKFHKGNGEDGKHYWLTPPDLMSDLSSRFGFDFEGMIAPFYLYFQE